MAEVAALTDDEFRRLCDFFYRRTGMVFTEAKRYYVERRVQDRILATEATSFAGYFARVRADLEGESEFLINAFTVNETYFYREDHQLRCLTKDLLPDRIATMQGRRTLRIWSVPCSTGEEPYSIAMWLLENWALVDQYDIEIIGSDIDTGVLERARAGIFPKRSLQRLSQPLINTYFSAREREEWKILDDLRDSVQFSQVNIVDADGTRRHGKFDVIFCRNVLIYFDDASRRMAAENLYENLVPGGYICLGHTESMSRISPLFDVRRFTDAIVYQRPFGARHA